MKPDQSGHKAHHSWLLLAGLWFTVLLWAFIADAWWKGALAAIVQVFLLGLCWGQIATARADINNVPIVHDDTIALLALRKLLSSVLPLWQTHVELARAQTAQAAGDLTEKFISINHRLGETLSLNADSDNLIEVFRILVEAQVELPNAVNALDSTCTEREDFLARIHALEHLVDELFAVADEDARIASQTNDLYFSAANEGADAGENGRGFNVVADEFHKPPARSGAAGALITEKMWIIRAAVRELIERSGQLANTEQQKTRKAKGIVGQMLDQLVQGITQLDQRITLLHRSSREVEQMVNEVLIDLQFQDRVSQIISHITDDMRRLLTRMYEAEPLNCDAWLHVLKSSYTTLEQARIHGVDSQVHVEHSSVTFF